MLEGLASKLFDKRNSSMKDSSWRKKTNLEMSLFRGLLLFLDLLVHKSRAFNRLSCNQVIADAIKASAGYHSRALAVAE
jgi:plasmid replication initiation protein